MRRLITAACIALGAFAGVAVVDAVRTFVRGERAAQRVSSEQPVDVTLAARLRSDWPPLDAPPEESGSVDTGAAAPDDRPPTLVDLLPGVPHRTPREQVAQPVDREPPTPPSIVAGEAVSTTSVRLTWRGATDDVGITHYEILSGDVVILETASGYATISELEPATEHCFKVRAYDAAGQHSRTTPPLCIRTPDPAPPEAPRDVVATAAGPEHVVVRWSPVADDPTIVRYEVLRGGEIVAAINAGRADELGLQPGTRYCYSVRSVKQSGSRSAPSAEACATTTQRPASDAIADAPGYLPRARPPATPTHPAAVPNSRTGIAVVWLDGGGEVRTAAYEVLRDGKSIATTEATLWIDRELVPGSEHCYTVAALGSSGLHSAPSEAVCARPLSADGPGAPLAVEARRETKDIRLSWRAPGDGVVYRIYDARGRAVGSTSGVAYRIVEQERRKEVLEPCFTVAAVDADGRESARSGTVCAEPLHPKSANASPVSRPDGSVPPAALAVLPLRRRRRKGVTFVA